MSYYVRVRGRVQGPFTVDQLMAMIQKGQLSRIHEISQDQQSWSKVSDFTELFIAPMTTFATSELSSQSQPQEIKQQSMPSGFPQPSTAYPPEPTWYYNQNGNPNGPVPQSSLMQMFATGQLSLDVQVWTENMSNWLSARQVPLYASAVPSFPPQIPKQSQRDFPAVGEGKFCHSCGSEIASLAEICPKCGVRQASPYASQRITTRSGKDRVTAALFALLLGGLGAHKFYLGEIVLGVIYLLFCFTFIPAIVALIEGIIYLSMSDQDFALKYANA